jgi:hypothetical protein
LEATGKVPIQTDVARGELLTITNQVKKRMDGWMKARTTQSESPEQMEWAANVVQYVNYVYKASAVRGGVKKGNASPALRKEVPIFGPRFLPPAYMHIQKRNSTPKIVPTSAYLKPLHIVHPFYYPDLAKCPQCNSDQVSWQGWTTTGYREVHGVRREETALGYQLECEPCKERSHCTENASEKGPFCHATTNVKFWERKEHWDVPRK